MRKSGYLMMAFLVCVFLVGCAPKAYVPVDLNPQVKSGQLVQKTDNFVVLFDKSASMDEPYGNRMRLDLARDVTVGMIKTIPDIKLNAGLRTFWGEETALIYGMAPLNQEQYIKSLGTFQWGTGRTPLGRTVTAAGEDLKPFPGNSALIIVSDFEDIGDIDDLRSKGVLENIAKVKGQYGDRLCIYTILVGNAPGAKKLAEEIASEGKCGFATTADELSTPAAMAAFVEKVFFGAGKPAAAQQAESKPAVEGAARAEEAKAVAAAPAAAGAVAAIALENIHFDYDKSTLRPKDRDILKGHADWLKKNPKYYVIVEGHCDERGTTDYNLALGERRATEAKKYLVSLGVEETRVKTISYGEEKPLDPGHTEEAWAKNRRAQFEVKDFVK